MLLVSPAFRPLNFSHISQNIKCSIRLIEIAVRVNICFAALVMLAITCRCELCKSKYKSVATLIVNLMAILIWIVANGAYSQLISFSITFCCIIDPNRSSSLVICSVTLFQMVAILIIINNFSITVKWLTLLGCRLIYSLTATRFIWPRLVQLRRHYIWIRRRCVVLVSPHLI